MIQMERRVIIGTGGLHLWKVLAMHTWQTHILHWDCQSIQRKTSQVKEENRQQTHATQKWVMASNL